MSWEMVGAVAELLGAIGVIVSLLYLAAQVRDGAETARTAATREMFRAGAAPLRQLTEDGEVARIFVNGQRDWDGLDEEQRARFSTVMLQLLRLWDQAYHFRRTGQIDDWVHEAIDATRGDVIRSPGFRSWFEERKHWASSGFRAVVEREIAKTTDEPG